MKRTFTSSLVKYCNRVLKAILLVVLTCNISGAFAETIEGDVTVNPGETLTINSEVTITGNLINNGGTITIGAGGVLTVNRDVTNTSSNSYLKSTTKYYRNETECTYTQYEGKPNSYPSATTRSQITTKEYENEIGVIDISNGGELIVKGKVENKGANLTITSTDATKLSRIVIQGNLTNTENVFLVKTESKTAYKKKKNSNNWVDDSDNTYTDKIIESIVSSINLYNGYIVVKGDLKLQDNSVINYNPAFSLGDNIHSTIKVSGNVTQAENADINLELGAKGKLIVEETYTDNTISDGNTNHPWSITEKGKLVIDTGFDLYAKKYISAKIGNEITEIDKRLDEISEDLAGYYIAALFTGGIAYYILLDDIKALEAEQTEKEKLKTLYEILERKLGDDGVKALQIETESAALSALLPIELTSFTATATKNGFVFNWVTASENENDYFTLEYSIDGVDFNEIDYVHGAGTTSETSEYEYRWDEAPEFEVVYFRLKQTDYNGEYSYSDVIAASRKKSSGANGTFRYGPLNLQIQDGELRYIQK